MTTFGALTASSAMIVLSALTVEDSKAIALNWRRELQRKMNESFKRDLEGRNMKLQKRPKYPKTLNHSEEVMVLKF